MKRFSWVFSLILLFSISAFGQTKTFKWDSGLCSFEGTYNSSKYSENQLRDTQKLMSTFGAIPLMTRATVSKHEQIQNLDVKKLDSEYKQKKNEIQNLNLVKTDFWEKMRQRKLSELEQFYKLSRVTMQGYTNPSVLKEFKQAEFCVNFYVEPLIQGGEYLYATWLKVNMDSRSRNASPQRLKRIFESQNASPDRMKYAQVEVMSFGWWNCSLRSINELDPNNTPMETDKNFRSLFTKVKEECDEP